MNAVAPRVTPMNHPCDVCGVGAIVKMNGGFVCEKHYYEITQKNADRYCEQHDLDTTEKKIAHCRGLLGSFLAKQKELAVEREPGSDDV